MTIIAKGAEMNGSMDVEGNVRVDGTVHGDVRATEGVEVGKTGRIFGSSIESKTAVIHGYVESHLIVSQHILLGGKSTLVGDLNTKTLVIEEGAVFHGNSAMMDEPAGSDRANKANQANQANQASQADRVDDGNGGDSAASGASGAGGPGESGGSDESKYPYGR
ncbi:MAG: polymer-forming cytoskeletal protein [Gemmatimonadetes bacterium]|nr:polymer-forming cytoskeletal protein [Gemmatimonadota bacterium]